MPLPQTVNEPQPTRGNDTKGTARVNSNDKHPTTTIDDCDIMASGTRQIVVLASTMRSGSTLLKALLAQAPDVTHLHEINFQRLGYRKDRLERLLSLDDRRIVVLKKPAWYHEARSYPVLPTLPEAKLIVLVRDVYETVRSLRKMTFGSLSPLVAPVVNGYLVHRYWAQVNLRLLNLSESLARSAYLVRYEDIVCQPLKTTKRLFAFLGSVQRTGVDSYHPPVAHGWRWGRDDASDRIKTLKVQPLRKREFTERHLLRVINRSRRTEEIRKRLGYPPLSQP